MEYLVMAQMEGAWYQVQTVLNVGAQVNDTQDTYEKITAVINLYRALGGGQK